ncbi:MAG: hypothetical protein AAB305_02870 [Candidatus Zixiibacteriota bacterium]
MKLLDYLRFNRFVESHFGHPDEVARRMVGRNKQCLSSYVAIRRFFGDASLNPQSITVTKHLEPFLLQDKLIARFSNEIQGYLRSEGRLFDGPLATHVVDEDYDADSPRIVIQPCDYALQAGSCFALDLEHLLLEKYGGTLRHYYYQKKQTTSVNPLPQCLGVCAFLLTHDPQGQSVVAVSRSSAVASYENSIGPSVAGSIDFPEEVFTLADLLIESLVSETEEELGLKESEITITPLSIARELYRGERPQLFGLIETRMRSNEVLNSIRAKGSSEIADCSAYRLESGSLPDDVVATFNPEAQMAWYLCEEYLEWRTTQT